MEAISFGIGHQYRRFLCSSWKFSGVCKGGGERVKADFAELLERLDPKNHQITSLVVGPVKVPKKSLGAGCMRVADTFVVANSSTEKD